MDAISYQKIACVPSFADPNPYVWRPMLPVYVYGFDHRLPATLVDTGATETVLPMAFWGRVSPAHREGEVGELSGADGSTFEVRYGTVDLAIRLGNDIHRWSAKVAFSDARDEMVLGDAGFLRHFTPTFHRAGLKLSIRRAHAKIPPPPIFIEVTPTGKIPRSLHREGEPLL
jgi:hypothetical protein